MNSRLLKWFMIVLFSMSALTGCFFYHDRDGHYHDRDDRHYHDRDDGHHRY